jgi:hypothetical protein
MPAAVDQAFVAATARLLDGALNFNDPPDQWINGRSKILRSTQRDEKRSRDRIRIDAHIVPTS